MRLSSTCIFLHYFVEIGGRLWGFAHSVSWRIGGIEVVVSAAAEATEPVRRVESSPSDAPWHGGIDRHVARRLS